MPPETSLLLYHEPMSAVLARVAYRLIELDYRRSAYLWTDPPAMIGALSRDLDDAGFRALGRWVAAYAHYSRQGVYTAAYKQRVVRRARWAAMNRSHGKPWARVPGK